MCSDGFDESVFKLKKEYIDMRKKMDDKLDNIEEVIDIFVKMNDKLKKNVSYINLMLLGLFDESQLIYKINAKIDDTLNFVYNEIYRKNRKNRKNRISSNKVNINKLKLLERMSDSSYDMIREALDKILIFPTKMFGLKDVWI